LIWTTHGLLFRWRATRATDEALERPLVRAAETIRAALSALAQLFSRQTSKPS
jgi:hypothetical protein